MTTKITASQRDILNAMADGQRLIQSKRPYDYGKYFIIRNGVKKQVRSSSVDSLIRNGLIKDDSTVINLEVTFKVAACLNEEQTP
jgi:hypothetical protein